MNKTRISNISSPPSKRRVGRIPRSKERKGDKVNFRMLLNSKKVNFAYYWLYLLPNRERQTQKKYSSRVVPPSNIPTNSEIKFNLFQGLIVREFMSQKMMKMDQKTILLRTGFSSIKRVIQYNTNLAQGRLRKL